MWEWRQIIRHDACLYIPLFLFPVQNKAHQPDIANVLKFERSRQRQCLDAANIGVKFRLALESRMR